MKKWLARIGWMVLGAVLLTAFVLTKTFLFGEWGRMLPNATTSQIDATLTAVKKADCSYNVTVYVPKNCKEVLNEAVKQSGDKKSTN